MEDLDAIPVRLDFREANADGFMVGLVNKGVGTGFWSGFFENIGEFGKYVLSTVDDKLGFLGIFFFWALNEFAAGCLLMSCLNFWAPVSGLGRANTFAAAAG